MQIGATCSIKRRFSGSVVGAGVGFGVGYVLGKAVCVPKVVQTLDDAVNPKGNCNFLDWRVVLPTIATASVGSLFGLKVACPGASPWDLWR